MPSPKNSQATRPSAPKSPANLCRTAATPTARHHLRFLAGGLLLAGLSGAYAQTFSLTGSTYDQNFDGSPTSATSNNLPLGWVFSGTGATFGAGTTVTTRGAGTTGTGALTGSSAGGSYYFVNGVLASGTDRALGLLSSGSFAKNQNIIFGFTNNTATAIADLTLSFDYEKYRSGSASRNWTFFSSTDGTVWSSTITAGGISYAADANNNVISNPPLSTTENFSLTGINLAVGASFYLRWNYDGSGTGTNGQALGIDNFHFTTVSAIPPKDLVWNPASSAAWNTTAGNTNWLNSGGASNFTNGDHVTFDDTGLAAGSTITVDAGGLNPGNINFTNTTGTYQVTGGALGGTGTLSKTGAGIVDLNTTYANNIAVNGGTLRTLQSNLLADTANVTVGQGATFALANTATDLINNLQLTGGTVQTGTGTLTVSGLTASASGTSSVINGNLSFAGFPILTVEDGAAAVDLRINAAISGGASLSKAGPGVLALHGATDVSVLNVTAGTALVNGALTGQVTVTSGATLGGTGTITGSTLITENGLLAPGDGGIGTLTFNGDLDLSGAAGSFFPSFSFELGATSDRAKLSSGTLTIGAGTLEFSDFSFLNQSGFGPGTYLLFDTSTPISGSLGSSLTGTVAGLNASLSLADNGHDLVLTVVPEPGAAALLLGGLAAWSLRRRAPRTSMRQG